MKIEKDHLNIDDGIGAEEAMDACMGAISDILLFPALDEERLNSDESEVLAIIGGALKTIAKKAQAYEDIYEKGVLPQNSQN